MADKLKRILYVEDEPDIQTVARLVLETLGGFTVEICSSGSEALSRAPDFQPQLFLLDVMMPLMDGRPRSRCCAGCHSLPARRLFL